MNVKICGITSEEIALSVANAGADMIGFVFAPSKRRISPNDAAHLSKKLPNHIKKVGVFVNESLENILFIAKLVDLDIIQLHGDETSEFAKRIPYPIMKAFSIDEVDPKRINDFPCDYLLIDSPGKKYRGGSGDVFDWDRLLELDLDRSKMMLAGGLHPENVKEAINKVQPFGVDVSSGVETDGEKDEQKIRTFIQHVRQTTMMKG